MGESWSRDQLQDVAQNELDQVGTPWAPLSDLAAINPRSPAPTAGEMVSFVAMGDVSESGVIDRFELREATTGYTPFAVGDVLVAKITPCFENGKGAHVGDLLTRCGLGSTEFHVLRPGPTTSERYLYHLTRTARFRLRGEGLMSGSAGQRRIPTEFFGRYTVRRPPLAEQRRIAEVLDTIDETVQATERVITKLWAERAGAMENQLASIDAQCCHSSLCDVVSLPSGQVDPRVGLYSSMILVAPDHILSDGRGRLIARVSAEAQGAISGKYRFNAGDVVYSKIRPELRKAWLATFDGLCSADMYPLSPAPGLLGGYLASVILGHRFSRFAASVSGRSSGMPKVNRRELAEFQIALPRLEVQQIIADLAESYERRIDAETAILHKTIGVREGLAADLLSGRVRTVAA